jgi:hypothetical protein
VTKKTDNEKAIVSPELMALAEQQGVGPVNLDELLSKGPRGPADETADMMIEAIYQWRSDEAGRTLP